MKDKLLAHPIAESVRYLISWSAFALVMGAVGGAAGSAFGWCIRLVTGLRTERHLLVLLMPLCGMLIAFLYRVTGEEGSRGTDMVLAAASDGSPVTRPTGPLIFVSTVLSHLSGASVGREGAALQLGGWLGARLGELFRLKEKDARAAVMCGMAAVFAALFGTPVAAAVFCIEVISVGSFYYAALLPCVFSAYIGVHISRLAGLHGEHWQIGNEPVMGVRELFLAVLLGLLCAVLAIVLVEVLHGASHLAGRLLPNPFLRAALLGLAAAGLTLLMGTLRFTGAGTTLIDEAMEGIVDPPAFLLKLLFTALAVAGGFKGGEIVPTLSIGAAFGALFGSLTGLPVPLSAACGMIALFAGATNCPIASLLIAMEMFHGRGLEFFAIAVTLSFVLSGYYSLYETQNFFCSKLKMQILAGPEGPRGSGKKEA